MNPAGIVWDLSPAETSQGDWGDWDGLRLRLGAPAFLRSDFLIPLLRHFGEGREIVAVGRVAGRVMAMALLSPRGWGRWSLFQPSQLPLGPWLCDPGFDSSELAAGLLPRLPGLALGLSLSQLDSMYVARPCASTKVKTADYIETAWIDVHGNFDVFWEARGKNLRANLRKQRNKLDSDGIVVHFEALTRPDEVGAAIGAFARLESAGWKSKAGTAVDTATPQGCFYSDMMRHFCASGQGEVWQLRFGDRVVAVDLCIFGGGTLVILKTAYDPEYAASSPAFLLKREAFRRVFESRRVARVEFYGRRMEWHTRWTESVRTLFHISVYRWALVPSGYGWLKRLLAIGKRREPAGAQATQWVRH